MITLLLMITSFYDLEKVNNTINKIKLIRVLKTQDFKEKIKKYEEEKKKYIKIYFVRSNCTNYYKFFSKELKYVIENNKKRYNECIKDWDEIFKKDVERNTFFYKTKKEKRKLEKFLNIKIIENENLENFLFLFNGGKTKLTKEEYKKFIKFVYRKNKKIEDFIKKYNKFLKENNIKQDIKSWSNNFNKLINLDSVKCNTYTLTLFQLFWENFYDLKEINDKNIKEYFYKIFNKTDDFRKKVNREGKYVGWYNDDIFTFLNSFVSGIYTKNYVKKYKYKGGIGNGVIGFIITPVNDKYNHSGIIIKGLKKNYIYFPEDGKIWEEEEYKKKGRHKKYQDDVFIYLEEKIQKFEFKKPTGIGLYGIHIKKSRTKTE